MGNQPLEIPPPACRSGVRGGGPARAMVGRDRPVARTADGQRKRVPGEQSDESCAGAGHDRLPPAEHNVEDQQDCAADGGHEQGEAHHEEPVGDDDQRGLLSTRWKDTGAMSTIVARAVDSNATV